MSERLRPLPPPTHRLVGPDGLMDKRWYDYFLDMDRLVRAADAAIADLTTRMEAAETTLADHETRIEALEP